MADVPPWRIAVHALQGRLAFGPDLLGLLWGGSRRSRSTRLLLGPRQFLARIGIRADWGSILLGLISWRVRSREFQSHFMTKFHPGRGEATSRSCLAQVWDVDGLWDLDRLVASPGLPARRFVIVGIISRHASRLVLVCPSSQGTSFCDWAT